MRKKLFDEFEKGYRIGKIVYTGKGYKGEHGRAIGLFDCDCGKKDVPIELRAVKGGYRKTCGCLIKNNQNIKPELRNKLYNIWRGMKRRCLEKESPHYKNYGGRGITICNNWIEDFDSFADWALSVGWKEELTLDRIDVNGNYEPNNCRWVTMKEQQGNKRSNVVYTYQGTTKCLEEWLDIYGINRQTYYSRLKSGKTDFEELFAPRHKKKIK